jgi:hypothetical protein
MIPWSYLGSKTADIVIIVWSLVKHDSTGLMMAQKSPSKWVFWDSTAPKYVLAWDIDLDLQLTAVWMCVSWVEWLKKESSEGRGKGAIEWPTEPNREIINAPEGVYMHPGDIL